MHETSPKQPVFWVSIDSTFIGPQAKKLGTCDSVLVLKPIFHYRKILRKCQILERSHTRSPQREIHVQFGGKPGFHDLNLMFEC